ncbi:glucuronate isomerase, partial [Eisenbergiella porci]
MDENFLLQTPLSRRLYHGCAEKLPVIDYHNHLNIRELAEGTNYPDLARLWLISDPYKHRAMRICGVDEFYITGGASDYDKFRKWMSVLPRLIGNPLYDWSILEMKRCFRIELQPGVTDADWLWETAGKMLARPEFSVQALLDRFHVEYAAPCAAITEDIAALERMGNAAPSLRGD